MLQQTISQLTRNVIHALLMQPIYNVMLKPFHNLHATLLQALFIQQNYNVMLINIL